MLVPLRWIQSFAAFDCTPQQFSDKMTMSGSKVEKFESEADHMNHVVVGQIDTLERVPETDHLWLCQVNTGDTTHQIVTGAQNLKEGDLCPVALPGAVLPNGTHIKKSKLRGVESNGMLCSLPELGLTEHDFPAISEDGIIVFDEAFELGSSAAVALGMDDVAVEFEITPNRPDCLSVRGLGREAAATFKVPFEDTVPQLPQGSGNVADHIAINVEATDTCNRYACAIVENVRIKPSPQWMRERLRLSGVRPINNMVDITNYVMLEYGQPMHAFDLAYVNGGKITVRKAKADEMIETLDGEERTLDETMMVIADEEGPIAVAGVMGGEYSGVYDTTHRVVFESASFDGPSVRATSNKIGLRTESSTRFEKGLDSETVMPALHRALELVEALDAGDVISGVLDDYPTPKERRTLEMSPGAINELLGIEVPEAEIKELLLPLGFAIDGRTVHIPTFRDDVSQNCDLAEEVARYVGYNNIPSSVLRGEAKAKPTERHVFEERACQWLAGYGFWECATFSFYSPDVLDKINLPQDSPLRNVVTIANPLGKETSTMRTTALPSLMEVVARNCNARNDVGAFYELATVYHPHADTAKLPHEPKKLVLAAYGDEWHFLSLKGVLEALFEEFWLQSPEARRVTDDASYHPGRCADLWVTAADGTEHCVARVGELHPDVMKNYDVKPRVVAAEVDMDSFFACRGPVPQYKPLARYPAVHRDLALVAADDVPAGDIEECIRQAAGKRLERLSLFDVYSGDNIAAGSKSLAYSLMLRDAETTLKDKQADKIIDKILAQLAKIDVKLRS